MVSHKTISRIKQLLGRYSVLLLGLAVFGIYGISLSYPFAPFDDPHLIVDQLERYRDFSQLPDILRSPVYFSHMPTSFFRPVLLFSFVTDTWLGGGEPWAFHFTNVLLHLVAVICFWAVLRKLYKPMPALMSALVFAAHPVNVHAVCWIPGRNDILQAIFLLLGLYAFLKYEERPRIQNGLVHVSAFSAALLIKESAVVFPILLPLFLFIRKKRVFSRPNMILLLVDITLIFIWLAVRYSILNNTGPAEMSIALSVNGLVDFFPAMLHYFGKFWFPLTHSIMPTIADIQPWIGVTCLLMFFWLYYRKKTRPSNLVWFGVFWFVMFLTVPNMFAVLSDPGEFYEHRAYCAIIGLLLVIPVAAEEIGFTVRWKQYAGIICVMIVITCTRVSVYENPFSFAQQAVNSSAGNDRPHLIMADLLKKHGERKGAEAEYNLALELNSHNSRTWYNRGLLLQQLGDFTGAFRDYAQAIDLNQSYVNAYVNQAGILQHWGHLNAALAELKSALEIDSSNALIHNNISVIYFEMGNMQKARTHAETAENLGWELHQDFRHQLFSE